MAMFDRFSRKASEVTSMVGQKTKEFSEIARLTSSISEEERQQSSTYCELGKLYYSRHSTIDAEDEYSPLIRVIIESEQKIAEMKRKVQDLKGIQCCEACGAEVLKGSAFCNNCGAPMPQPVVTAPVDDRVTCRHCGARIKKGIRFCTSCGKPMEPPVMPLESAPPAATCRSCGAELEDGAIFCLECGARVEMEEEQ